MIPYLKCLPPPGALVAVFCAGMRGANYQPRNPGESQDFEDGRAVGVRMPRRTAKKRASRILHENRMLARRWGSRGNVDALCAVPPDAGFTRYYDADFLRDECANAGQKRSFAATAVKLVAEQMGLLTPEALAAYEEGRRLDDQAYKLPVNTPERIQLHEQAYTQFCVMAAAVASQLPALATPTEQEP